MCDDNHDALAAAKTEIKRLKERETNRRRCDAYSIPGKRWKGVEFCSKAGARVAIDVDRALNETRRSLDIYQRAEDDVWIALVGEMSDILKARYDEGIDDAAKRAMTEIERLRALCDVYHNAKKNIAVDEAIEVLNRALDEDPATITKLMDYKVFCNEELANDPTIQIVSGEDAAQEKVTVVGPLGLINGLFGVRENGWGWIAAVYEVTCSHAGVRPSDTKSHRQLNEEEMEDKKVGDPCPWCKKPLITGKLLRFERTDSGNIKMENE